MKKAFLFPGQGAQSIGMGQDLYESHEGYRTAFDEIDAGLPFSLKAACFSGENMERSEYIQPAIYAHSLALLSILDQKADVYAGLSLGEYTALAAAGVMDVVEGARLVNQRGRIMDEAVPPGVGGMLSVMGMTIEAAEAVIQDVDDVWAANHLSEKLVILAGQKDMLEDVQPRYDELGARTGFLNVSGPFHSPMLREAADTFKNLLGKVVFNPFDAIIYSNYTAQPYTQIQEIPNLLAQQMCSRVRWHDCMETLIADGVTEFVEIGPSMVLSKMLKRRLKGQDVQITSIRDAKTLAKYLG